MISHEFQLTETHSIFMYNRENVKYIDSCISVQNFVYPMRTEQQDTFIQLIVMGDNKTVHKKKERSL